MLARSGLLELETQLERCSTALTSCAPADRSSAEVGIARAYAAADLAPPRSIIWCDNPLQIARQIASAPVSLRVGSSVKGRIFEQVRDRTAMLAEIFWKEVLIAANKLSNLPAADGAITRWEKSNEVSAGVSRVVLADADDVLSRFETRIRHAWRRCKGLPRLIGDGGFNEVAIGPHDFLPLSAYRYLQNAMDWDEPSCSLQGLWQVANSAGWVVPYEHVCWVSERPAEVRVDQRARLHCVDGPALRYRDGWSVYAWKGVKLTAWMIETPEQITPAAIDREFDPAVRDCLIEIMTPERFVRSGTVMRVCEDETGILWRKIWLHRGVTIGSWTAVEVVNGTAEKDGSRRRYFLRVPFGMRTAREAVAWTYGLTAGTYKGLELRT